MAVILSSSTRSSRALIEYLTTEQPDQRGERYVMASGVGGLMVSTAEQQMRAVRQRWGKDETVQRQRPDGSTVLQPQYLQAYHLIQSFDLDELDPDDPEAWLRAQRLARAFVEDQFPGRQALIVTQRDGRTGCLHNHIALNSIETSTGRSLNSSLVTHSRLVQEHDRVLHQEGLVQREDLQQAASDSRERYQRGESARVRGRGENQRREQYEYTRYMQWESRQNSLASAGIDAVAEPEPFSVAVLKHRIEQAMHDPSAVDWNTFVAAGAAQGVEIAPHREKGQQITYGMYRQQPGGTVADPGPKQRRLCTTLGPEFGLEAVQRAWKKKQGQGQRNAAAPSQARQPAPKLSPKQEAERKLALLVPEEREKDTQPSW